MYYRRKILLALMQQFGGSLARTDLQKLLFLYSQKQSEPAYHFIPYKFGCFSYQANQDVSTMIKYKQIEESNTKWNATDPTTYLNELKPKDRIDLIGLYNQFKNHKGNDLVKYVYEHYPYYAINSEIAEKLLNANHLNNINLLKPNDITPLLFTIGYEGKAVEEYVNQLIKENIKVLCDVRKNPISMKYGFSKNQLKNIVENVGIRYQHFPELGINSDKRQNINSPNDYKKLFEKYAAITLPAKSNEINKLADILIKEKRIALTCFEADYMCCHRNKIAESLYLRLDSKYKVKHI